MIFSGVDINDVQHQSWKPTEVNCKLTLDTRACKWCHGDFAGDFELQVHQHSDHRKNNCNEITGGPINL